MSTKCDMWINCQGHVIASYSIIGCNYLSLRSADIREGGVICDNPVQTVNYHYNDVIMSAMASQITGVSIVCSTVGSGADQGKHQRSTSLAFVWGIHRSPVNSPHKRPVTRKMFLFHNVIMWNKFASFTGVMLGLYFIQMTIVQFYFPGRLNNNNGQVCVCLM